MNLASILAVALILFALGVVLWRRSKRADAPRQMKMVGAALVTVGALGVAGVVVDLVMFALFP